MKIKTALLTLLALIPAASALAQLDATPAYVSYWHKEYATYNVDGSLYYKQIQNWGPVGDGEQVGTLTVQTWYPRYGITNQVQTYQYEAAEVDPSGGEWMAAFCQGGISTLWENTSLQIDVQSPFDDVLKSVYDYVPLQSCNQPVFPFQEYISFVNVPSGYQHVHLSVTVGSEALGWYLAEQ